MRAFLLTAVALFANIGLARAEWQYTRWGMTPSEVISASEGKAVSVAPTVSKADRIGSDVSLLAPYATSHFKFRVGFVFEQNRLSLVRMLPIPAEQIFEVGQQLANVYGKPVEDSARWDAQRICHTHQRKWRDENNEISHWVSQCIRTQISPQRILGGLTYAPIMTKEKSGL